MKNASQLEPFYWAPQKKLGGGWVCSKDSPSPPPAPDYKGAAEATASSGRYNQSTPLGSLTWSQGAPSVTNVPSGGKFGDIPSVTPGQWSSEVKLDPRVQQSLDTQLSLSNKLGSAAEQQAGKVQSQGPMDLQSVQDVSNKAYGAMTSRLDPQWNQREKANDTQLANQGIMQGSEAYDNAKREFGNQRNDAYTQANLQSNQLMPAVYGLGSDIYNQPLNRLNALRTGAQVNNPQFQQPGGGANLLGAAQAQSQYGQGLYGSEVASTNSANSNGAALAAALIAASDRRLKRDIEKLSDDPRGFGIYKFRYLWSDDEYIGVMADEVEKVIPEAVITASSGYKSVNYGML